MKHRNSILRPTFPTAWAFIRSRSCNTWRLRATDMLCNLHSTSLSHLCSRNKEKACEHSKTCFHLAQAAWDCKCTARQALQHLKGLHCGTKKGWSFVHLCAMHLEHLVDGATALSKCRQVTASCRRPGWKPTHVAKQAKLKPPAYITWTNHPSYVSQSQPYNWQLVETTKGEPWGSKLAFGWQWLVDCRRSSIS